MGLMMSRNNEAVDPLNPYYTQASAGIYGLGSRIAGASYGQGQISAANPAIPAVLQRQVLGEPLWGFVAAGALLLALKYASEHEGSSLNPAHLHVGGYNLLAVTIASIVGIVALKAIVNRWPVPGVTQFVNAA